MRAFLIGQDVSQILDLVREAGFDIVTERPDLCICFGGDGTLLGAERDYPGITKLAIRNRRRHDEATRLGYLQLLKKAASGEARATRLPKLLARTNGEKFLAVNDIIVRNSIVTSAVRFSLSIDGIEYFDEIVGDGLVVSTPFGSTAYYRSITNSIIHVGIGLAFNNSTEPVNHLVLGPDSTISIEITRGPALLAADNNPRQVILQQGDVVNFSLAPEEATVLEVENLLSMSRPLNPNERRLRWLHSVQQNDWLDEKR